MKQNNQICIETKLLADHGGYSLVELVVSLLVSSMVIIGATLFLSVAVRNFQSTDTEVSMQTESQIALNLIENLLIEANEYVYFGTEEDDVYHYTVDGAYVPVLKIGQTDGTKNRGYWIVLNEDTHQLILLEKENDVGDSPNYSVVSGTDPEDMVLEVYNAMNSSRPPLLANYVTSFEVTPFYTGTDTIGTAMISIKLEKNGRDYVATKNISLRNGSVR